MTKQFFPAHIFVVEDSIADFKLIEINFKKCEGCILHHFKDGEQLLEKLNNSINNGGDLPCLIITDYGLPKLNGIDIIHAIKTNEKLKPIPVILFTGSASEEIIREAYMQHVNSVIIKPHNFEVCEDAITKLISFWLKVVKLPLNF